MTMTKQQKRLKMKKMTFWLLLLLSTSLRTHLIIFRFVPPTFSRGLDENSCWILGRCHRRQHIIPWNIIYNVICFNYISFCSVLSFAMFFVVSKWNEKLRRDEHELKAAERGRRGWWMMRRGGAKEKEELMFLSVSRWIKNDNFCAPNFEGFQSGKFRFDASFVFSSLCFSCEGGKRLKLIFNSTSKRQHKTVKTWSEQLPWEM